MNMPEHDILFFRRKNRSWPREEALARAPLHAVVIGNHPPRRCGLATFTADMVAALGSTAVDARIDVYAMVTDPDAAEGMPVHGTIVQDDAESYRAAGQRIEASQPDVVWLQHEFGVFGGKAGEMIIEALSPVAAPLVVTLHTILEHPDPAQRRVIDWLVARASRLVVMSEHGRRTLLEVYAAAPEQVVQIVHGAPDRPLGRTQEMKRRLGLHDCRVLLTFGLISPGKGIEQAITALPAIVADHPDTCYIIAGATHPNLVAREGEAYRERLQALAAEKGVTPHIRWIDKFLDTPELLDLIEAADIYITPYTGPAQSTSGTLSYAVALGKAVVSTPYLHASELLADDHGVLIPFGDAEALATAVGGLLDDPLQLEAIQRRAYRRGRESIWPRFGEATLAVIDDVRRPAAAPAARPLRSIEGLERLCDDTGMMQHAVLAIPDRAHGYCIDDNARALMLANLSGGRFGQRAETFAAFVQHAWNPDQTRFRNFMDYRRRWLEPAGSDDSCGRTLWALGATAADGATVALREWAARLFRLSAPMAYDFGSPRAMAFCMLGADRYLDAHPSHVTARAILALGVRRLTTLLDDHTRTHWHWFEPGLAYDNARLPEALLRGAIRLGDHVAARRALDALEWLDRMQTSAGGHFRPVGSAGFGGAGLPLVPFDQQPVDAWAMVDAAALAWRYCGDAMWLASARRAYAWFFGANDRGMAVADPETGTCRDGVTPQGVNLNEGAESVLSLHLAWCAMAMVESDAASDGGIEIDDDTRSIPA